MEKTELLIKMLEQDNKNPSIWYLLGLEYCALEDYSQAFQAFSEALKYGDEELRGKIIEQLNLLSDRNRSVKKYEAKQNDADSEEFETVVYSNDNPNNLKQLTFIKGSRSGLEELERQEFHEISFEDVGGLENLKNMISMKIIMPFKNPNLFEKFKKKIGGGILLYGPPGCGKTYIAKATAGECKANFISVSISDILDMYVGVSEQNISDIFANARSKKPCVLFFDEIDALGYNRSKLSSEHMRPVIDQLLSEIEGIDSSTEQLLIIGATNMPWDVDTALKRPGRFDKTVFVPPPDEAARISIFKMKMKEKPIETIDYELLAKKTELYSGADIENVIETATERVLDDILSTGRERLIAMKDLEIAIANTKPST
ncbi:MAG: AAA family ATPase, partial [Eubacteriaceae bacterium]|nr:AAA family ATPase [Eubacteriaceae bacterium]